jgi:hypothetical protein
MPRIIPITIYALVDNMEEESLNVLPHELYDYLLEAWPESFFEAAEEIWVERIKRHLTGPPAISDEVLKEHGFIAVTQQYMYNG